MNIELKEGGLLQWKIDGKPGKIERLLHKHPDGYRYFFIEVSGSKGWPQAHRKAEVEYALDTGKAEVLSHDECMERLWHDADLSEAQIRKRDEAWRAIEKLVMDPELKIFQRQHSGKLVNEAAKAAGKDRTTIYKYLRRFWQRGMIQNALIPDLANCGKPGSLRDGKEEKQGENNHAKKRYLLENGGQRAYFITKADREKFAEVIRAQYLRKKRRSLSTAFEYLLDEHYSKKRSEKSPDGVDANGKAKFKIVVYHDRWPVEERPTLAQFRYFFKKNYTKTLVTMEREGENKFHLLHRPIIGDQTHQAFGPGHIYQIDSTDADICLVHNETRKPVGRPTLYFVVDVFSTMTTGFHISLENAQYSVGSIALWNAYRDKVGFCREYGVEIQKEQWPAEGLPCALLGDRGEFILEQADGLVRRLGIRVVNTPPYRGDLKAFVERRFGVVNQRGVAELPGANPGRVTGPDEKDYRKDAVLSVNEFAQIIIHMILEHNVTIRKRHRPTKEALGADLETSPLNLWNWGMRNSMGRLRAMDNKWVRLALLPTDEGSVTGQGVHFRGLHYISKRLFEDGSMTLARGDSWKEDFSYHPEFVDHIFSVKKTPGDADILSLVDACSCHAGLSWAEFKAWKEGEDQKERKAKETRDANLRSHTNSKIRAVEQQAKQKTKAAWGEDKPTAKNIGESHENALKAERAQQKDEFRDALDLNQNQKPIDMTAHALSRATEQERTSCDELDQTLNERQT